MEPEDAFDAVHLHAADQVASFLAALEEAGKMPAEKARRHADLAYLFVEYLANTYPKRPQDATERDAWVFLFDYVLTQGPFAGPTLRLAPESLGLFVEWLATGARMREIDYLRAACRQVEYYLARLSAFERIAAAAGVPGADREALSDALDAWWAELDHRMREKGLAPTPSLAGGPETWSPAMGPLEAAVFDALCLLLMKTSRELRRRRVTDEAAFEQALAAVQKQFMTSRNQGLSETPLAAVLAERERFGTR